MSNQLKQDHFKVAAQQKEEDDQYLSRSWCTIQYKK